eukprot:TRINITY_DN16948_c0_g1_i2.p1 TRINITY_DN16948_c0_g1~~TRINITY_DN16948_c0_g1_i2.p1  ORF type:complete len:165 (+),score=23.97 TRINITY_DN16948_c0_g1_i2:62-556(+)
MSNLHRNIILGAGAVLASALLWKYWHSAPTPTPPATPAPEKTPETKTDQPAEPEGPQLLENPDQPTETDKQKLTELTNQATYVLVMKGTPERPRCKFSREMVEILAKHGVRYASFDILGDKSVRKGLKVFSNWPTYPQLYHKGVLVGGLDIIKDMIENGHDFQA